jgi:hypothetical protein
LQSRQFHHDPRFTTVTGRAKTTPPLLRTATHQTAGPLVSMPLKNDNYLYHDSFLPIPGLVTNFRLKQQILLYI